ncbi:MAG: ferrochelatase [Deltaproteobacteria bacterium]|nr:ferrochelatase [Deltaproteobacteria bacterium]
MARTHVWLLSLGGPASEAELTPWLSAVLRDPTMLPLPAVFLRALVVWLLLRGRAQAYLPAVRQLGGPAPQLDALEHQARALGRLLGPRYAVSPVFRHAGVDARRAAAGVAKGDRVVLLPMHPQLHGGAVRAALDEARASLQGRGAQIAQIDGWAAAPGYIDALAAAARRALVEGEGRAGLLLVARGLSARQAALGDPYPAQVAETAAALRAALPGLPLALCFAPVGYLAGPLRSHGPPPAAGLQQLRAAGVQRALVLGIGGTTDDLESAWARGGPLSAAAEGLRLQRVAPPVSTPGFGRTLLSLVRRVERAAGWEIPEDTHKEDILDEMSRRGLRPLPEGR